MAGDTWTLREAAAWLDPEITEADLTALVRIRGLHVEAVPVTVPQERRGRPARRYDVAEIIALHRALMPWLARGDHGLLADAEIVT